MLPETSLSFCSSLGARAGPATTSIRSRGTRPPSRSTASSAVELEPASGRSCLGCSGVLRGQNRVPEPPARMTAHLMTAGQRGGYPLAGGGEAETAGSSNPAASQKRGESRPVLPEIIEQRAHIG